MLIHVLNIKLTCEWHEAIKFNYSTTGTDVIFVIRVSKRYRLADADVTLLIVHSKPFTTWSKHICILHHRKKYCQLIAIVRRPARRPHFSLAIISVNVQLWTCVFWVISVYFTLRNTLPKSGTFLLGHPVYRSQIKSDFYTHLWPVLNISQEWGLYSIC
jgi:hypothetical protein